MLLDTVRSEVLFSLLGVFCMYKNDDIVYQVFSSCSYVHRPPLWSSGQSFWLQIQGSRVRFPAPPDFLSGSGSGTGYTQPREPREVN